MPAGLYEPGVMGLGAMIELGENDRLIGFGHQPDRIRSAASLRQPRDEARIRPQKGHPCWRVQQALDEAGLSYQVVEHTPLLRSRRTDVIAGTGQGKLPAIELDDGTWYRKESSEMAAEIRAGALSDAAAGP